jgi:hypothetical protein
VVRSSDFLRAPERVTAPATLIRQRRLTPSCGEHASTAERTVGPARMIVESLTPRPGIREQNRPTADSCSAAKSIIRSRQWDAAGLVEDVRARSQFSFGVAVVILSITSLMEKLAALIVIAIIQKAAVLGSLIAMESSKRQSSSRVRQKSPGRAVQTGAKGTACLGRSPSRRRTRSSEARSGPPQPKASKTNIAARPTQSHFRFVATAPIIVAALILFLHRRVRVTVSTT